MRNLPNSTKFTPQIAGMYEDSMEKKGVRSAEQ